MLNKWFLMPTITGRLVSGLRFTGGGQMEYRLTCFACLPHVRHFLFIPLFNYKIISCHIFHCQLKMFSFHFIHFSLKLF